MSDLISRQAAIDEIRKDKIDSNSLKIMGALGIGSEALTVNMTCDRHIRLLKNLPSAQPTYTDAEIQKMQDIEQVQIEKAFELGREDAKAEIIRCKGCIYHGQNKYEQDKDTYCFFHMMDRMLDDDYCSKAERRTDGSD